MSRSVTRKVALQALIVLGSRKATPDDYKNYHTEVLSQKNDRGAAILVATNLENALESAIARLLMIDSDDAVFKAEMSPLGTFANKIKMGSALRIFGKETRANLDMIRAIRNSFAHAKAPISFSDEAVHGACTHLRPPQLVLSSQGYTVLEGSPNEFIDDEVVAAMPARQRFIMTCENTSSLLIRWLMTGPAAIDPNALNCQLPNWCEEVWGRQKPLP